MARLVYLLLGILVGSLLSAPVSAQAARRMFATLSTNLTTGESTPVLCTASGAGCVLQIVPQ